MEDFMSISDYLESVNNIDLKTLYFFCQVPVRFSVKNKKMKLEYIRSFAE